MILSKLDPRQEVIVEEQRPDGPRHYEKGRFLGKGGFARVYEFKCRETQRTYAAKVVPKATLAKTKSRDKLASEIHIHKRLRHPNIVNLEHSFEDAQNVYILLELCPNQSLSELVRRRKRLTELEAQFYMLQTIKAVQYCHANLVIHRDLKIGNLFLNEQLEVKLGDFGLAGKLDNHTQKRKTVCGTPNYIAPEILEGKRYSYEVDVWSLGVILYTLVIGTPPFETNNVKKTYNLVKMNAYSFPDKLPVSDEAKSLITRILKTNPSKRPSLAEILQHPFFNTGKGIPRVLPISTLAMPPPESFIRYYMPNTLTASVAKPSSDTVPIHLTTRRSSLSSFNCFLNTQRLDSQPQVWVTKWLDYSAKFGLGYILSNNTVGVHFNDNTKAVSSGPLMFYIDRDQAKKDAIRSYTAEVYPETLNKKVQILQKFRQALALTEEEATIDTPVYVKKWIKTRKAIVFRLSSMLIQIVFKDQTELTFSATSRNVTFLNKARERTEMPLQVALATDDKCLTKRLKYAKEILDLLSAGTESGK